MDKDLAENNDLSHYNHAASDDEDLVRSDHPASLTSAADKQKVGRSKSENRRSAYDLDTLLGEVRQVRKIDAINADLQEGLKAGGVGALAQMYSEEQLENSITLNTQQYTELAKLQHKESAILRQAPGEHIFDFGQMGRLFHYPQTLTLASCGVECGSSVVDSILAAYALQPDMFSEFLNSCQLVVLCFEEIQTPNQLLDFLFLLLSETDNEGVSNSISQIISHALCKTEGKALDWAPSTLNVCRVFINCGASMELVELITTPHRLVQFSAHNLPLSGELHASTAGATSRGEGHSGSDHPRIVNMCAVIKLLTTALIHRANCYTDDDRIALFLILMIVALDPVFFSQSVFIYCFAALLNGFSEMEWTNRVVQLCQLAKDLTSHPHNSVYLLLHLPASNERGFYCRSRLAYAMMAKYISRTVDAENLFNLQVMLCMKLSDLTDVLSNLRVQGQSLDIYTIWAIIRMVDICVGDCLKVLGDFDREHLRNLHDFKCVLDSLKPMFVDSLFQIDHANVKNMIYTSSTKWGRILDSFSVFLNNGVMLPSVTLDGSQPMNNDDDNLLSSDSSDIEDTC